MATCSWANQINNRNFLSGIGFKFNLAKYPKVDFFCNTARIPEVTLATSTQPSYLKDIDIPGEKLTYGDLTIQFLVDENMENYRIVHEWITGLGFPETTQQFKSLTTDDDNIRDMKEQYADGTLRILNSNFREVAKVKFLDLFPVSLSSLDFDATQTERELLYSTGNIQVYCISTHFVNLMDLDKIQEMWQKDAVIDPDNLHDESLKIPQLHAKYYTLYNTITLLREKARETYNKVKLERYNYYTGKAEPEVYEEEPFPYKVREKDAIQRHMEADERLNKIDMKIRYYDTELKFLEEIIKTVANRTFQIKNAIEWQRFQAGF